ncbi:hypothetical protein SOPP22_07265 [Shewanella sp. OPT22]|nr:hypothetical protein SOPP22_07265 [Shewanella sp. OPT22]
MAVIKKDLGLLKKLIAAKSDASVELRKEHFKVAFAAAIEGNELSFVKELLAQWDDTFFDENVLDILGVAISSSDVELVEKCVVSIQRQNAEIELKEASPDISSSIDEKTETIDDSKETHTEKQNKKERLEISREVLEKAIALNCGERIQTKVLELLFSVVNGDSVESSQLLAFAIPIVNSKEREYILRFLLNVALKNRDKKMLDAAIDSKKPKKSTILKCSKVIQELFQHHYFNICNAKEDDIIKASISEWDELSEVLGGAGVVEVSLSSNSVFQAGEKEIQRKKSPPKVGPQLADDLSDDEGNEEL